MKDRIVGVSGALLTLVLPPKSRHHAVFVHAVSPGQVRGLQPSLRSPRLDPWPGPSRETVSPRWAGDERESTIGIP